MRSKEIFVPAVVTNVHTIDPGEIRKIELTLPSNYEVKGELYPIRDRMRPGNAFLAKPWGVRTGKYRRRMYTRSNCSLTADRILETIVNDTHKEKADTSPWWQSEELTKLVEKGGTIDVCVNLDEKNKELVIFENSHQIEPNNLLLESDDVWPSWRMLAMAYSTGITPFLAYIQYMKACKFGKTANHPGIHLTLVVSVRNPRQLLEHHELLELERTWPKNFSYVPVLTREWPDAWKYPKGRIIRVTVRDGQELIDIGPLKDWVPDPQKYHVRMCGNGQARDHLIRGLESMGIRPLSFRAEVW